MKVFNHILTLVTGTSALTLPSAKHWKHATHAPEAALKPRQSCENTATSRDCWGDYSIDTNYYVSVSKVPVNV